MIVGMVVVTVFALFAILAGAYFDTSGQFDRGLWPVIALVPLIALPLAVVLTISLVVVGARRRAADAAAARSADELRAAERASQQRSSQQRSARQRATQRAATARRTPASNQGSRKSVEPGQSGTE